MALDTNQPLPYLPPFPFQSEILLTAFTLQISGTNNSEDGSSYLDIIDSLPAQPVISQGPFGREEKKLVEALQDYVAAKSSYVDQKGSFEIQLIVNRAERVLGPRDNAGLP